MMENKNFRQAFEYIFARENAHVDVFMDGERVQYRHPVNEELTQAIQDILEAQPLELIIKVYSPNGSSRKLLKIFNIDLAMQQHSNSLATISQQNSNDSATIPQQAPIKIQQPNLGGLEGFLINDLRDKNKELKVENKELKKENRQLEKNNFDLEKRIELQEKDFEIQRMAEESESKGGLNGFINKAVENDKMMDALGMILSKLTNGQQQNSNETATISQQNGNNTEIRQNIDGWLASITPERATNIYQLFTVIASTENLEEELLNQLDDATETQN